MEAVIKKKEIMPTIMGMLFISGGVLCNEWFLSALFSPDGNIASEHRIVIWILDLFLIITGIIIITCKRRFSKEEILLAPGLLFIIIGVFCNEWYLPVLLNLELSKVEKIVVRFFDMYLIGTGLMFIVLRKFIRIQHLVLFGCVSVFCCILLLLFDFYQAYSALVNMRRANLHSLDSVHVADDYLGWQPAPNNSVRTSEEENFDVVYVTDQDGFRKVNNGDTPKFNIYFFGDSFTFGHGVENHETFSAIIKDKFLKQDVNVYNAGVLGYGIVQMTQRFLSIKDRIRQGDLVIMTPLSEDIKRNVKDFHFPYVLYFTNIKRMRYYPDFENGVIKRYRLNDGFYSKLKLTALSAPWTKNFWKALNQLFIPDTTRESIEMMNIVKRETEMKGGRFALFFLPSGSECIQREYLYDISGFQYFDIMNYFPSGQEEFAKLTFPTDSHWNVYGHEIAAKAIIETLTKAGMIDKRYLR